VAQASRDAEKVIYFVIPSEARNLSEESLFGSNAEKDSFLGAQRASE
jgi:hypothetical protein